MSESKIQPTRDMYVNNAFTSVQSSCEELFAPVVDKASVRIFLTACAMHNKHFLHLDVVSAYLHATLTGPPRYITLWGDEKGKIRRLCKTMNGVDSTAQIWNKHYHQFMLEMIAFMCTQLQQLLVLCTWLTF